MFLKYILMVVVIFLSSMLQGLFGFAFMLFALPLTSFFISVKNAVPLLSLFLAFISGILAFRLRGQFVYRDTMPLIIGAAAGIPIGIYFLMESSEGVIKSTLGIFLIVYSLFSLVVKRIRFILPAWSGYIFGFFAGALGGAFNITGPAVVVYVINQKWSKINTVASLNFFFFVTSILIVLFHVVMGNITGDVAWTFISFIPVVIVGMLSGTYIFKKMTNKGFERALFVILIIMGIILFI